jgi:hypothetical protein
VPPKDLESIRTQTLFSEKQATKPRSTSACDDDKENVLKNFNREATITSKVELGKMPVAAQGLNGASQQSNESL